MIDSPPWAGLWAFGNEELDAPNMAGIIMIVQEDFTVNLHCYDTEDELRLAWSNMERSVETREPRETDLIIWPVRTDNFSFCLKADFPNAIRGGLFTQEAALDLAIKWAHGAMTATYQPDIWLYDGSQYYLLDWEGEERTG